MKLHLKQEESSLERAITISTATKRQDFIIAKLLLHVIQTVYWSLVILIAVILRKITNSLITQLYSLFLSFLSIQTAFIVEFIQSVNLAQFSCLKARIEVKEGVDLVR